MCEALGDIQTQSVTLRDDQGSPREKKTRKMDVLVEGAGHPECVVSVSV